MKTQRKSFTDYPLLKDTADQDIATTTYYQHLSAQPTQDFTASVITWLHPYGFDIRKHKLPSKEVTLMRYTYGWYILRDTTPTQLEG